MDMIDIIMALEGGELVVNNYEEWEKVKDVASSLASSQGFYGRLLEQMEEFENSYVLEDYFPIYMQAHSVMGVPETVHQPLMFNPYRD